MITLHSQCQIIRQLLLDNAYGAEPVLAAVWPIYYSNMPDGPTVADNAIAVYDTAGINDGRYMRTGERVVHEGIQVKVRSATYSVAQVKAKQIAQFLDTVARSTVTLDGTDYRIDNISRIAPVQWAGQEPDSNRRQFFTINAQTTLTEI